MKVKGEHEKVGLFFFKFFGHVACGISDPWLGIKPTAPAVEAWSLNCWTTRKIPKKAGLKLNIQKTKIMASSPISSWQIDMETMETVTDFLFLGSKITADGGCNHEIERCLLLGRKAMTHLDSVLKSRDVTLPTKVPIVKVKVFPCMDVRVGS